MFGHPTSSTFSGDEQYCDVFAVQDLVVTSGVNAGECVCSAENSFPGDIYQFNARAERLEMLLLKAGETRLPLNWLDAGTADMGSEDGIEIGTLGQGLEFESRLVFVGPDGKTLEALLIRRNDGTVSHFLPLSPLQPGGSYTLVETLAEAGEFDFDAYAGTTFTRGTLIRLADGSEKPVEDLLPGDLLATKDHGAQPLGNIHRKRVLAQGHMTPVVISQGTLGNHSDLVLGARQRLLLSDWRAEVVLGSQEVLVTAKDLVNNDSIYARPGGKMDFFALQLEKQEIIFADGIAVESQMSGGTPASTPISDVDTQIIELFPANRPEAPTSAHTGRKSLKSREASAFLKQAGFR